MNFVGFYRLLNYTPAPVLPFFEKENVTFRQISDDSNNVSEYVEIQDYEKDRLFITNEIKVRPPKIGSPAIYSYEYIENSVAVGDLNKLKSRLRIILSNNESLISNDFAKLEIATFINDEALILESAKECYRILSATSQQLPSKWLMGAPISSSIKQIIRENFASPKMKNNSFGFRYSCRKIVNYSIEAAASRNSMDKFQYISESIDTYFSRLKNDSSIEITKSEFEETKALFYNEISSVFSSFHSATVSTIQELRNITQNINTYINNDILEFLVKSEIKTLCHIENKHYKVKISDQFQMSS
ncbi:hypothetical protein DSM25558_5520 [Agrobacterium sp. DSM 25558]|uniref:hypothetical protein n=1 Tax=Agrobacterium sp. DSM 25558 TaxID=1907665 RepID=UPI00097255B5|nr:hypothetical protein [Agrobacterium sp. DSM 25558]SCX32765.1 hypothetical protein DSM25558_5520 [Agrobacterium sp. DSM 25558]